MSFGNCSTIFIYFILITYQKCNPVKSGNIFTTTKSIDDVIVTCATRYVRHHENIMNTLLPDRSSHDVHAYTTQHKHAHTANTRTWTSSTTAERWELRGERPTFAFEFNKTLDTVVKKECIKSLCVCGAAKPRNSAWNKWRYTSFWHTDNDMCPDHRSLSIRERWFNANVGLMGIPRRYHRAHVIPSSSKWTSHLQYSSIPHTHCLCLR